MLRTTQWKKSYTGQEWEDDRVICLAPKLKVTVWLQSSVVSGRESRSLCTLSVCCNIYLGPTNNQREFCPWVQWGQDFTLARTRVARLVAAAASSADHTALVNWSVPGFPIELCRDRDGWQTWLHELYSYLFSYKWKYTTMYLGKDFSLRNKY